MDSVCQSAFPAPPVCVYDKCSKHLAALSFGCGLSLAVQHMGGGGWPIALAAKHCVLRHVCSQAL